MILDRWIDDKIQPLYRIDSAQSIFTGLYIGLSLVLLPVIARQAGASASVTALIFAGQFIGCLFAALWVRRSMLGKRLPFILKVRTVARLSLLGVLVTDHMLWFLAITCVVWIFEMASDSARVEIQRATYPARLFGRTMAFLNVEMHLGIAAGSFGAGLLMDQGIPGLFGPLTYRVVIPLGIGFGLLAVAVYSRLPFQDDLPIEPKRSQEKGAFLGLLKHNRLFRHLVIVLILFDSAAIGVAASYKIFLVDKLGGTASHEGYLTGLWTVAIVVSLFVWAAAIDRLNPLRLLSAIMGFFLLAGGVFLVAEQPWHLAPAYILIGIGSAGGTLVPIKIVTSCAGKADLQRYWGILLLGTGAIGVMTPQIAVWLNGVTGSFLPVFWGALAMMALAIGYNEVMLKRPEIQRFFDGNGSA